METTLGAVATLGGGTTPSKADPGYWEDAKVPWATPSDITSIPNGESQISSTDTAVSERALRECSLPLNPPGTILMTSRATIGYAAINAVPMATNQGFITFRCNDKSDPHFLYQWLIANRRNLMAAAGGSTFKELGRGTAKLLPILLPPVDEQRRIARVLGSLDDLTVASSRVIEQAHVARSAVREGMFTNLSKNASPRRLGDVCTITKLAGYEYSKYFKYGESDEIIALRGLNLKDGMLALADLKYVSRSVSDALPRSKLWKGDLVLSYVGTIGEVALIDKDDTYHLAPNVALLRCGSAVTPAFVLNYLYSSLGREEIRKHTSKSSQESLSMGKIREFAIPTPDISEQEQLCSTMSGMDTALRAAMRANLAAISQKELIAADLISGRVRVPA